MNSTLTQMEFIVENPIRIFEDAWASPSLFVVHWEKSWGKNAPAPALLLPDGAPEAGTSSRRSSGTNLMVFLPEGMTSRTGWREERCFLSIRPHDVSNVFPAIRSTSRDTIPPNPRSYTVSRTVSEDLACATGDVDENEHTPREEEEERAHDRDLTSLSTSLRVFWGVKERVRGSHTSVKYVNSRVTSITHGSQGQRDARCPRALSCPLFSLSFLPCLAAPLSLAEGITSRGTFARIRSEFLACW